MKQREKCALTIRAHQRLGSDIHGQCGRSVSPRMLGLIQRRIRSLDEHVHVVSARRHKRIAAEADRHAAIGRAGVADMLVDNTAADLFGDGQGTLNVGACCAIARVRFDDASCA